MVRQNTLYENDYSNWVMLCSACEQEYEEYWHEMWEDYNQGRM